MARTRAPAKGRRSGRTPADPAPDTGGEARNSAAAPSDGTGPERVAPASPPAPEREPAYNRIVARTVDDILKFGDWLAVQEGEPLGFAFWEASHQLGISSKDVTWLVYAEKTVEQSILQSVMFQVLCRPLGPKFVCRDLSLTLRRVLPVTMLKGEKPTVVDHFVGDLTRLCYAVGGVYPEPRVFASAAEDALDVRISHEQLLIDCPAYYQAVALPNVKHAALAKFTGEGHRFQINYDFLFYKVLAHLSHDPTLYSLLRSEDADVVGELAGKLVLPREQVFPVLAWVALGSDAKEVLRALPELDGGLPDNPHDYQRMVFDKVMPNIRLWVIQEEEEIRSRKGSSSLYGRRCRTTDTTVALHHLLFGTVRDIIEVAKASLLNFAEVECVFETSNRWWERAEIVGYTKEMSRIMPENLRQEQPFIFEQRAEHVCSLGDPLGLPDRGGIPLKPKVVVDAVH